MRSLPKPFWAGLILVGLYWFSVHPPDFNRLGYVEDIGGLETVQIMAENLKNSGGPVSSLISTWRRMAFRRPLRLVRRA